MIQDVKWKSPWYINPLTSRTTVSLSCTIFKVLLKGTVAGWQSYVGPHGKLVLNTLFVRLTKPPCVVRFDGLLENVVPIAKMSQTIECTMKSDRLNVNNVVCFQISP